MLLSYLNNKMISLEKNSYTKDEILEKMVNIINEKYTGKKDINEIYKKIIARENVGTTGIGKGIAVPHARCESINEIIMAIMILKNPVEYSTPDGENVNIIIMLVAPKEKNNEYLNLLASISDIFRNEELRKNIINCNSEDEILELLIRYSSKEII
ncbi:MAG: PTS sugar transporter subunit IIA [Fusobacteria bacterium]|nr:PTS sugar transporter subunit IIA [Fusobacteriota bacterium]